MNRIFKLVGYLGFPNLEFITAVPIFAEKGKAKGEFFRQRLDDGKIESFERVDPEDSTFRDYFKSVESKIIKVVGDSAVLIQANLGQEIVSASIEDHRSDLAEAMRVRGPDLADPILGLELAEFVGDQRLAEMYFRRVARVAYSISPEAARMWSSRHRLAIRNQALLNEVNFLGSLGLTSVDVAKESHVFAKNGFGDSNLSYFCSGFVLEYLDLFDVYAVADPIIKFARPMSEVPSNSVEPFVVFVAIQDFSGRKDDVNYILEYVRRGLNAGGSLVLLVDMADYESPRNLSVDREIAKCLDLISSSLRHASVSSSGDFICILFSQEPTSLRKAIRQRTGPSRLQDNAALLSAKLMN